MKAYTKRSNVVKVAWALQKLAEKCEDIHDICNVLIIAEANGLAAIESSVDYYGHYDFTFGSAIDVYKTEIIEGRYYFVPQDVWNEAAELDEAQNTDMNRRMALMKYATEKTYDEMKAAGF